MAEAESFDWDEAKSEANYRKHGVDFETAIEVFADPLALESWDSLSAEYGEDRFVVTGMAGGQLLTVVYTERNEVIRLISARKASKREHDDYYR
jgi:uncharacterized DUF497 family protein